MKASDGKVVHVYAMYCMLAKGALLEPQNPSEMGLMRGSKSLAFWGRGAHFAGGGPNHSYSGITRIILFRMQALTDYTRKMQICVYTQPELAVIA